MTAVCETGEIAADSRINRKIGSGPDRTAPNYHIKGKPEIMQISVAIFVPNTGICVARKGDCK